MKVHDQSITTSIHVLNRAIAGRIVKVKLAFDRENFLDMFAKSTKWHAQCENFEILLSSLYVSIFL